MDEKIINRLSDDNSVQTSNKIVESKSKSTTQRRKSYSTKDCDVLVYNKRNKTAIISFDGFGYELTGILENPGNKISVRYYGNISSPNFKIELKK